MVASCEGGIKMGKRIKLLAICVLLTSVSILSGCSENVNLDNTQKKKNIALIVKMKNGDYWKTVKMGADVAAREFDVNVDFNAPDDEEDIEGQIRLVNEALEKKVGALILAASDYKALAEVTEKAYNQKIPVIIIDAEVNTDRIHSFIGTDNRDAGIKAGEKLVELAGTDSRIAIMSFVKGTGNAEQREEGLMSVISKYPQIKVVAKEYSLSDTKLANQLTKKIISEKGEIDAIVALNAISSIGVAQAIYEMNLAGRVKVITFDSTPEEIEFIEKEVIQATIIQNPFSMGYLGVKYAVEAMEGKKIPKRIDTGSKAIDKNNMYLPANQKLVFPFVK
jgi:ribose transport system substrate-binding protein